MTEDRDLLPWILGGLSVAAIAMAVAVGLTGRTTPPPASSQTIPSVPTAQLIPKAPAVPVPMGAAPVAAVPPAGAPTSTAPTSLASAPSQSDTMEQTPRVSAPIQSGSRIWECTTNGVKTFSNNRCGSGAVVRDVGPINVMDASPVASNVHWYEPDSNDTPDYYPNPPPAPDNSYPVVVGIPYLERRRPEHPHQPNHNRTHPRHN